MVKTKTKESQKQSPKQSKERSLGFKCGLEIHQQLDTGKLFCRCPSTNPYGNEEKPEFEVIRTLRAGAGESGEVDIAATHEQVKAKRFRYKGHHATTCLVELDEEPPRPMNQEALRMTIQTAKLLKSNILDEITVMRKTVVDGSNTSGFQRTALVAMGGRVPEKEVRIQSVCLEEDACKIIERKSDEDLYDLSRLGVPLIEIATEPDITTPEEAQETAAEIGMVLRSTGRCKRGLGTIRQDLNVSIVGGARVELKGAQELRMITELVRNEGLRQKGLLEIKDALQKRKVTSILLRPPNNLYKIFNKSRCTFVRKGIESGKVLIGLALPKMEGLLGKELFTNYRLGTELAGYAKSFGFGGLIHSDEDLEEKYGFTKSEILDTRTILKVKKGDAFLLFLGEKERIEELIAFLLIPRIEQLLHGVPNEVRKANQDGTSSFLRPMPGSARMYPETDLRTVRTNQELVKVPKLLKEQERDMVKKFDISPQYAKEILRRGWSLEEYTKEFPKLSPSFITKTILDDPKEIRRRYNKELSLEEHEKELKEILKRVNDKTINEDAVFELLIEVAKGEKLSQKLYDRFSIMDKKEIERIVADVVKKNRGSTVNALMGEAMKRLRGKASGKVVIGLIKEQTKMQNR